MKKLKYYIIGIVMFGASCKSSNSPDTNPNSLNKTQQDITEVEVSAITRGYKERLLASPEELHFKSTKEKTTRTLTNEEWQEVIQSLEAIDLTTISSLEAPTSKRLYDGDLATNLIIRTRDSVYTSASFDKENPPQELNEVMSVLYGLKR